jgi:hypothetical protein
MESFLIGGSAKKGEKTMLITWVARHISQGAKKKWINLFYRTK